MPIDEKAFKMAIEYKDIDYKSDEMRDFLQDYLYCVASNQEQLTKTHKNVNKDNLSNGDESCPDCGEKIGKGTASEYHSCSEI